MEKAGFSAAARVASAGSLGAGLIHAWRWGLFYSNMVFPFDEIDGGAASMLICWNIELAICFAIALVFSRRTNFDFQQTKALIPAACCGAIGTLLVSAVPAQDVHLVVSPLWIGLTMCAVSMSFIIIAWSESFSCMESEQVKSSASLFIAFGTIIFLICSLLPNDVARLVISLFPLLSCGVLRANKSVRIIQPESKLSRREARPLAAFTICLLSLSAANSFMRGLGLTVMTADGNARLLFSTIVATCIALLFAKSQKPLFSASFLAVATGLELLSANSCALGSTILGSGFVCYEVLVWMVVAETAKKSKVRASGIAALVWLGLHVGSLVGVIAGLQVPLSNSGMTQAGRNISLVLLFAILCAFTFCFSRNFLDMFDPARDSDQPAAGLAGHIETFARRYELSPRETEICAILARGMSVKYIAAYMVLSENTVKTHVRSIYKKAHVSTKDQLIQLISNMP